MGLISDFGYGPYAGVMSEVVRCLGGTPLDIDHSIPSFSIESGAYIALQTYRWLPRGSSLAVVVDPGVGTYRKSLIIKTKNYFLVGPDNGVLYPAAKEDGIVKIYNIDVSKLGKIIENISRCKGFEKYSVSNTFHGRDVFAPAATLLTLGFEPETFATPINENEIVSLNLESCKLEERSLKLKVIYIDKFGNAALSCRLLPFSLGEEVVIKMKDKKMTAKVVKTFQNVSLGNAAIYLNSFGFLEIGINQGSLSNLLKLKIGDEVFIYKQS